MRDCGNCKPQTTHAQFRINQSSSLKYKLRHDLDAICPCPNSCLGTFEGDLGNRSVTIDPHRCWEWIVIERAQCLPTQLLVAVSSLHTLPSSCFSACCVTAWGHHQKPKNVGPWPKLPSSKTTVQVTFSSSIWSWSFWSFNKMYSDKPKIKNV